MSDEEKAIHQQKISSGIKQKKKDCDKIIAYYDDQLRSLDLAFEDRSGFKLGRSRSAKKAELNHIREQYSNILSHRENAVKFQKNLDNLHKTRDWQRDPEAVMQSLFKGSRDGLFMMNEFLVDPYHEGSKEVMQLAYASIVSPREKDQLARRYKTGRIIGEPLEMGDRCDIEFLYGYKAKDKATMTLIKRGNHWYLYKIK